MPGIERTLDRPTIRPVFRLTLFSTVGRNHPARCFSARNLLRDFLQPGLLLTYPFGDITVHARLLRDWHLLSAKGMGRINAAGHFPDIETIERAGGVRAAEAGKAESANRFAWCNLSIRPILRAVTLATFLTIRVQTSLHDFLRNDIEGSLRIHERYFSSRWWMAGLTDGSSPARSPKVRSAAGITSFL